MKFNFYINYWIAQFYKFSFILTITFTIFSYNQNKIYIYIFIIINISKKSWGYVDFILKEKTKTNI
jgi:hypothetical protein